MTRFKEKTFVIDFPVFAYHVNVIITNDIQRSRTDRNSQIGSKFDLGPVLGLHSSNENTGGSWIFLYFDASPDVIAHESYHSVVRMLSWVGANPEEEVVAYHLGYVTDKIHKFINKFGKSKKK